MSRCEHEIFWDQIFIGEDAAGPQLQQHVLRPAVAELRYVGYPREYSPDGANPTLYDYQRIDQGVPFKNLTGHYTRFGDVRPLLEAADDQCVIFARGEEIALEFASGRYGYRDTLPLGGNPLWYPHASSNDRSGEGSAR